MRTGVAAIGAACLLAVIVTGHAMAVPPAGPPYPDPVTGRRVYDYAGVFRSETIEKAEQTIDTIEARTGAQIAVYTQVKPESDTLDKANSDALALMNQWGVGRKNVDDGLVIMFDLQENRRHGQLTLYAGAGFRSRYLSDGDRQSIFDDRMRPLLAAGDLDGGLLVGLDAIDAAMGGGATASATSTPARPQAVGLDMPGLLSASAALAAGVAVLGLGLWFVPRAVLRRRRGRSGSSSEPLRVKIAPSMAAVALQQRATTRALSAAIAHLASEGLLAIYEVPRRWRSSRAGIRVLVDDVDSALHGHPRRHHGLDHLPGAERALFKAIQAEARRNHEVIGPDYLGALGPAIWQFREDLETEAIERTWISGTSRHRSHLLNAGLVGLGIGAVLFGLGAAKGEEFVGLGGIGLAMTGAVAAAASRRIPTLLPRGREVRQALQECRESMRLALAEAASLAAVEASPQAPWSGTPESVIAWAVAFGLQSELDDMFRRSIAVTASAADVALPRWWQPAEPFIPGATVIAAMAPVAAVDLALAQKAMASSIHGLNYVGDTTPWPAPTRDLPWVGGGHGGGGGGGSFGGGGGGGGGGAGGGF
jgi:uncharacterized membrane protein YgcG